MLDCKIWYPLCDTWSDPHEVHDLATAPDSEPILVRLYSEVFPVALGTRIKAKAVRYGWAESRSVRARP